MFDRDDPDWENVPEKGKEFFALVEQVANELRESGRKLADFAQENVESEEEIDIRTTTIAATALGVLGLTLNCLSLDPGKIRESLATVFPAVTHFHGILMATYAAQERDKAEAYRPKDDPMPELDSTGIDAILRGMQGGMN